MHRTREAISFWWSTLVRVGLVVAWEVAQKSPSSTVRMHACQFFSVYLSYSSIDYNIHVAAIPYFARFVFVLNFESLSPCTLLQSQHACNDSCTVPLNQLFLHTTDCHNNTFLAVRVFDNNKENHVYTEFFLTGMHVCSYLKL